MKKNFCRKIGVMLIVLFSCMQINAQNKQTEYSDTSILKNLLSIKLKKYKGKSVDKFLSDIKYSPMKMAFIEMKPKTIAWGRVKYSDAIWVDIYIKDFEFMKKTLDEGETAEVWREQDFRKEVISKIRIVKNRATLKQYPKKPDMPNL